MSEATKDTVKCPNCGTESETYIWESLNSILNHDEVARMLEGSLFAHECPSCHSSIELTYPCLYNDMEHGVMVQYIVDESKLDEAIGLMQKQVDEDSGQEGDLPITTRIVTSHNALREKALIFKDGYNDMAMEALKAVMMNRFIDEGQIEGEASCFYSGTTDADDIVLTVVEGPRAAETLAPRALYNRADAMVAQSPYAKQRTYVVDSVWAALFFQKMAR